MKINANIKNKTLEFIPEGDLDSYQIGKVFGHKNHTLKTEPYNKIVSMEIKINDIWAYLLKCNCNA